MDKTYDPHRVEKRWYERWEREGHFVPAADGEPYCIMIPPPNVTGTLHMGHAFQVLLACGYCTFVRMATLVREGGLHVAFDFPPQMRK